MKTKIHLAGCLSILAFLLNPTSLRADVVADWNALAAQAIVTAPARPGPSGVIDIAIMHLAIYDAVQAIERRYEPYRIEIPNATGSPIAAAAKAGHDVLVNRFPAQTAVFDAAYQQSLASNGLSESDPGVAVGARAAAGIIAVRACDGSFPNPAPPPFFGGNGLGVWQSTVPMACPWLGNVTPFTMTSPAQFRAEPPPALTSHPYAKAYNEVKEIGAANSTSRTPDQTDMAYFFAGNTPVIWNRALRDVANANVDNIADSSRLFALVSISFADALITSWNSKNAYVYWRPSAAIQQGENDGNPRTMGDPGWTPLLPNPPYPDHTSGANAFASSTTRALENFFHNDHIAFSLTTTNTGPTVQDTRTYRRFSDAAKEVVEARIYGGIHFRFADEAARKQGLEIADWAFKHFLRPLEEHAGNMEQD